MADDGPPATARTAHELALPDRPIDVVALGASAGGVEALQAVVGGLPASFPAAVLIVLHVAQAGTSVLADILDRAGPLPVANALDGEHLRRGRAYVAPPNHHMVLSRDTIELNNGPRENGHRPAIDPLLRSAAEAFGARAAGVILSGTLDDGTAGLRTLALRGGTTLAQDPETALHPGMPRSAAQHAPVAAILPLAQIAPALVRLARSG